MTRTQTLLGTAAAAAVGLTALTAAAQQEEELDIIVVSHGAAADPFWTRVQNGVQEAADHVNVDASYQAPDRYDMVRMRELLDAAVAEQPDGLVVSIPDVDALGEGIRNAVGSGIPVISMNTGSEVAQELGVMTHVGQTEYEAGVGAGEKMAEAGDIQKAVCVNQEVGNVALDRRCNGFEEGLPDGVEVEVLAVEPDPTEIENAYRIFLQNNPETNATLALGPVAAHPVLSALKSMGATDAMNFATFDLSPQVLEAVEAGEMQFAVDQQQYLQGYLPITLLAQYNRRGVMPANDVIRTGPGFVTPENASAVIEWSEQGYR